MSFGYSTNGELFHGQFEFRCGAVAEAVAVGREHGYQKVWVGRSVPPTQPEDWWNAEDWLEHVSCQDEYSGDYADGWDESTREQREELEATVRAVMAGWLDRHKLRPKFFTVDEIEEIVVEHVTAA